MSVAPPNVRRVSRKAGDWVDQNSVPLLRYALVVVFVWSGALSLIGAYPAAVPIAESLPVPNHVFMVAFGLTKFAIAVGLVVPSLMGVASWLVVAHMAVVAVPMIVHTSATFIEFPYAPSFEGVFILKDWVLLSGIIVVNEHRSRAVQPTEESERSAVGRPRVASTVVSLLQRFR